MALIRTIEELDQAEKPAGRHRAAEIGDIVDMERLRSGLAAG